jgi:hypothetical protein
MAKMFENSNKLGDQTAKNLFQNNTKFYTENS